MPIQIISPAGMPLCPIGTISQTDFPLVSSKMVNQTDTFPLRFGEPFVVNTANDTYSSVVQYIANYGAAAFITLMQTGSPEYALGIAKDAVLTNTYRPINGGTNMPAGAYFPSMMVNGVTRGTVTVPVNNGTPTGSNVPIYIRTALNASIPAGVIGGIEAVADVGNTIQIPNIIFKTGLLSTDPLSGKSAAQVTILERRVA